MGIWDRLFGGRFTMPPPDETNVSANAILKEIRGAGSQEQQREQKQALKTLTRMLLEFRTETDKTRLVSRVMRRFAAAGQACTALVDGLLDDPKGPNLEQLALLYVDWKGYDEFEYQAPYLVRASGVAQPYAYVHQGTLPMEEVLAGLDQWLARFGKRYVHLDSGGDEYVGFIVDTDQVPDRIELARRAGINASLESF